MFWGDGDSSKLGTPERKTLEHLRRMAETGHIHGLSPKESEIAIEAINFYATVRSTKNFVVALRNVLLFAGVMVGIWWATQDGLADILQRMVSSGTGG
jgi:hypothetical protein